MRYPACLPLCALLLAGCAESPPPPLANYHAAQSIAPLPLVFAHGEAGVPVSERPELRALTGRIPASTVPVLFGNDSLLSARAASVGALLRRPVRPVLAPDTPPDQAVLSVAIPPAIMADACLRSGGLLEDGTWPGQDDNPIRLLPPGCATATDIAAQTARPADLLLGRPLPPAAALPYAQAIERYYRRNQPKEQGSQQASQGGSGSGSDQSETVPQGGLSSSGNNPLLGPVPKPGQAQ